MSVRGEDETVAGTLAGLGPTRTAPTGVDVGAERIANRYQIVRWLGGGGMGRVYEAFDTELGERVALKVLSGGLTDEAHERFRREVRLTRRIQHRNVARMFDIGEHAGEKFLTMELIDGEPLTRLLGAGPLGWGKLRSAALQIAQGLAAAHEVGVIHRDLKPDNVLVELATGRFVITDFGIARSGDDPNVTQVGAVVGTPRYMAPEQLAGRDIDARADLFAYGVMLFELATGTRPWSGDNPIAIAVAQATQPSRPFVPADGREVPPAFGALVMACLALEPDARPPSAIEIARRITDETDPSDTATGRTPKFAITTSGPAFAQPTGSAGPSPTAMRTIATAETSIVVLPVTCAPGDEYLADGMHEDLIDTLSTIPTVRVRPAGLVRGVIEPDVRALGRTLEVEHVVSVSLRRTPAGLRVAGRLIGVADGFQIWAHRADCVEAEVLAQTDILARGIATALSARAHPATRPTDPRAVELYLRARAELRHFMAEHVRRAAELLEEAYLLAPTSAPILGARAYAAVQSWVFLADPRLVPIAWRAIEQGLAAGHGEAYLASAIYKLNHGDTLGGATDLGHALTRGPMSAQTHEAVGKLLLETGPLDEARHAFDTAMQLDPGRALPITSELIRLNSYLGDYAAAERGLDTLQATGVPALLRLAALLRYRLLRWTNQRTASLREETAAFTSRFGPNVLRLFDMMTAGPVDLAVAERELVALFADALPRRLQLFSIQILAEEAVAEHAAPLALLAVEYACKHGLIDLTWIDRCPVFTSLRLEPRWQAARELVVAQARQLHAALRAVAPA